jgi:LPXTG-site transpeptidase (sortase) family protein
MQLGRIFRMGERSRIMRGKRRTRLYALVAAACLAFFGVVFLGVIVFGAGDGLLGRITGPITTSDRDPASDLAAHEQQRAAEQEESYLARARQAASEQAAKEEAKKETPEQRPDEAPAQPAIPSDTTMYLTIPRLGLNDIPVLEGRSEAVLSQGVGHLPGTGFPWMAGSNTYIAGHRLGYPGTVSDHVFWGLPSLAMGDEVILEDTLGQTYTYRVSDILEVSPNDTSVTASTGSDVVSLQTCIENYGDYWTPGPDWYVRYVVRATRVN